MTDEAPIHKRRVRYKGKNPRRFEEKYKELNPSAYASELEKVKARGQTPAGTHRSIMVAEILEALAPRPGFRCLDVTLGYGGHSRELLQRILPGGHLVGLDVDPLELPKTEVRLRGEGFGPEVFETRRMNFGGLPGLIPQTGPFDAVLADLGLSSMQIDNPARGFTFKLEGPLDLRLNPQKGKPASVFLSSLSEEDLADLLAENADEPLAAPLARALAGHREPFTTTTQLADFLRDVLARDHGLPREDPDTRRTLQRTFQALRIAVNEEFKVLDQFLAALPKALKPGGRVAILTFHSGEDRRVKKAFQEGQRAGLYAEVSEVLRPSLQEQVDNPRSKPAKLRWAVRA
ncbi:MAG TPA: 16S rRNA (cytosine(1402)-N(4))-methyltransferase RsmH [Holophagaceae bacterium]|nr:16S rRNA (cytosine(1402)-N(4))-methyltransferase RsmH [Holophagaceae bacterium]